MFIIFFVQLLIISQLKILKYLNKNKNIIFI